MPTTNQSEKVKMIWGFSLQGWEDIMRVSLALIGIFGLIVGVSTWFVVKLQREEIRQSNERIAANEVIAGRLKSENLILQKELIATQHALADRHIWPDASAAMQKALAKFSGTATRLFVYPASSSDTFSLGLMIWGILSGAGWKAVAWDMHAALPIPGISILYREGTPNAKEAADALAASLSEAKIPFVLGPQLMKADEPILIPPPPATVAIGDSTKIENEETVRIFIGGKENPFR